MEFILTKSPKWRAKVLAFGFRSAMVPLDMSFWNSFSIGDERCDMQEVAYMPRYVSLHAIQPHRRECYGMIVEA